MAAEELKIEIIGEGGQLKKTLGQLENELKDFNKAVKEATTTEAFNAARMGVVKTEIAMQRLNATTGNFNKANSQAVNTLSNLSRVAQDAPYGFIGIANNLNPLLESFQRLRAESTSNIGALKALGQSLIGPAGIGLAIGLVSSLLVKYGDKLGKSETAADKLRKKTEEAKKATEDFLLTLGAVAGARLAGEKSAQKELINLDLLYKASQNQALALNERKKAVDALQEQYPKYFKNVKDETILAGGAATAYHTLKDAILAAAQARAAQDKLVQISGEKLDREAQYTKALQEEYNARVKLNQVNKEIEDAGKNNPLKAPSLISGQLKAQKEYNAAQAKTATLAKDIFKLTADQRRLLESIDTLVVENGVEVIIDPTGNLPATKKEVDKVTKSWERMAAAIKNLPQAPKINTVIPIAPGANLQGNVPQVQRSTPAINYNGLPDISDIIQIDRMNKIKETLEQLGMVGQLAVEGISSAFASLGTALINGQNALQAFAGSLVQSFNQAIAQLMKTAAVAAMLSLISGGAAGGGLSFLSIFKGMSGLKIPRMATGGIVPSGFPNDSFPAMLSSNEAVIPLNRMEEFRNTANDAPLRLSHSFRGREIVLLIEREKKSQYYTG